MTENLSDGARPVNKKKAADKKRIEQVRTKPKSTTTQNQQIPAVRGDGPCLSLHEFYSRSQVMRRLEVGRRIFDSLIADGLPTIRRNGKMFFSGRQVIEWMEALAEKAE